MSHRLPDSKRPWSFLPLLKFWGSRKGIWCAHKTPIDGSCMKNNFFCNFIIIRCLGTATTLQDLLGLDKRLTWGKWSLQWTGTLSSNHTWRRGGRWAWIMWDSLWRRQGRYASTLRNRRRIRPMSTTVSLWGVRSWPPSMTLSMQRWWTWYSPVLGTLSFVGRMLVRKGGLSSKGDLVLSLNQSRFFGRLLGYNRLRSKLKKS